MHHKMHVDVQAIDPKTAVINLSGDVTTSADQLLQAAYHQASRSDVENIILNFEEDHYIDSFGLKAMVGLVAEARKRNQHLCVALPNQHTQTIFRLIGLNHYTTIYNTLDEALAGLQH